ncbi:putative transcription factor interactor and regulator CCHC(Zn) family [Helianthus annuus]|nr:putative transcription factor interactor and regulator CCHC(Zn) family [Helianthus annuus]
MSVDEKGEFKAFIAKIAKDHMALLATVLQSYEGLVAGRIENPLLTKEDYDQIDAEEMELMDIKWCLASVLRRVEKFKLITGRNDFLDAYVSTLGFDKSKVTCFRCREKGHFKRECKNRKARIGKQVKQRIHSEKMITIGKPYINKLVNNNNKNHKWLMVEK